jgi:DNA-binding NarL/FixJ family response regulator
MRVTVVCSDPLLAEGLQRLLTEVSGVRVTPGNGSIESASVMARGGLIDAIVVTTDNASPEALAALERLRAEEGVRIVAVSNFSKEPDRFELEVADILMSRDNGLFGLRRAFGMLSRQGALRLMPAIQRLSENGRRKLTLTRREADVVKLVALGKSNKQIADQLGLREQSIKNLVSAVMRKLNCENRVQLALHFSNEPTKIAG